MLQEARIRRDADQELELRVSRPHPQERDKDREDDGAHRIDPPVDMAAQYAGHQAEAVDEEVVAVVFPENADLGVLVA